MRSHHIPHWRFLLVKVSIWDCQVNMLRWLSCWCFGCPLTVELPLNMLIAMPGSPLKRPRRGLRPSVQQRGMSMTFGVISNFLSCQKIWENVIPSNFRWQLRFYWLQVTLLQLRKLMYDYIVIKNYPLNNLRLQLKSTLPGTNMTPARSRHLNKN